MNDATSNDLLTPAKCARAYAAACGDLVNAANACIKIAGDAVGARNMALTRPQHETSIAHFTKMAEEMDAEFVPLYREFSAACSAARDAAVSLLRVSAEDDPELVLLSSVDDDAYGNTGLAIHILRTNHGPIPSAFMEGVEETKVAIQGDIFVYGEDGFPGRIYRSPVSDERTCPWCAETIKAAAIICRYCGREVQTPAPALSPS